MQHGEPIRGILHSTNASAGVAVVLFSSGSNTARTLGSDEFLNIESIHIASAIGGDHHLYRAAAANGDGGTGVTVVRATLPDAISVSGSPVTPAGGLMFRTFKEGNTSIRGHSLWFKAPAGTVDVVVTGWITK